MNPVSLPRIAHGIVQFNHWVGPLRRIWGRKSADAESDDGQKITNPHLEIHEETRVWRTSSCAGRLLFRSVHNSRQDLVRSRILSWDDPQGQRTKPLSHDGHGGHLTWSRPRGHAKDAREETRHLLPPL